MGSNLIVLLEFLLIFGLVIGFGVWQLVSLRRDKQARGKDDPAP